MSKRKQHETKYVATKKIKVVKSTKKVHNCTFKKFERYLVNFEKENDKLLDKLSEFKLSDYDRFKNIKDDIQLSKELKIAELKKKLGININEEDESVLPLELNKKILIIQDHSSKLIDKVDEIYNSLFKSDENKDIKLPNTDDDELLCAENELNSIKNLTKKWIKHGQEINGITKKKLIEAQNELDELDKSQHALKIKIDRLTEKEFNISFEKYDESNFGYIRTTKLLKMTNKVIKPGKHLHFNLKEIKIISNGNFLIFYRTHKQYTEETNNYLTIYNPSDDKILNSIICDKYEIMNVANKIVIQSKQSLKILDIDLNLIKSIKLKNENTNLIGTDNNSFIFCIDKDLKLICYDLSLNENIAKFQFNLDKETEPFYLPKTLQQKSFQILHLEILDKLYIFKTKDSNHFNLIFYDQNGKLINESKTSSGTFKMNSKKDSIITINNKNVKYHDFNGNLLLVEDCKFARYWQPLFKTIRARDIRIHYDHLLDNLIFGYNIIEKDIE
jgi:hypothetical protein